MPNPDRNAIEKLASLETLELEIAKLVAGGDGLGFFEGIPVFVPRSASGDRLRVRLTERRRDYARGEIEELLVPGPGRVTPRCRHFDDCGGCDLQHLDYRVQVAGKVEAAAETLQRIGGIKLPENVRVVYGDPWAYRLRTTLHRDRASDTEGGPPAQVGYHAARSDRLVPVEECPILAPKLEAVVHGLPESLAEIQGRRIDLAVGDEGRVTSAPAGNSGLGGAVEVQVGDYEYQFDARCFFQTHRGLLGDLVDVVIGGPTADETTESAVELFAGVGLFTLPLAARFRRVTAVDSDRIATRYLKANARRNGVGNVEVITQSVDTWIPKLPACGRLVVDPPRSGLSPYARSVIRRTQIPHLTYVSCHPAALARDLAALKDRRLDEVVFLDLFPQTGHLEIVVQATLAA